MRFAERQALLAAAMLAVVLFIFFLPLFVTDRILAPADIALASPAFQATAPEGFKGPANSLLFDQAYQFVPWRRFAWQALRQGRVPLWNPLSQGGSPFIASAQTAVFYPINLLTTLLPFHATFLWSAIARLWLAGFFTYLLVRRYGVGFAAALLSAVSFMLCGYLVVWLGHPQSNVAAALPALVLCLEHLTMASDSRTKRTFVAWLALAVAVMILGGSVPTTIHVTFGAAAYLIARRLVIGRASFVTALVGLGLGLSIAAIQILPFVEWFRLSTEADSRALWLVAIFDSDFWRHLLSMLLVLFPNLLNNPTWPAPYFSFLNWHQNYNELIVYAGILPLTLGLVAILRGRRTHPFVRLWTMVGALTLGIACRWPFLGLLLPLAGTERGHPSRLRLIATFSICVLAGFGADTLLNAVGPVRVSLMRLWTRMCAGVALAGLAIFLGGNLVLPRLKPAILNYGRNLARAKYDRAPRNHPFEYYDGAVRAHVDRLIEAFRIQNSAMYASTYVAMTGALLGLWFYRRDHTPRALVTCSFVGLTALDLITFGWRYNPSVTPAEFFPRPPILDQVVADRSLFRMTALEQTLVPDAHMMFNMSDFRGLDYRTRWLERYLNLVPQRIPWVPYGVIVSSADHPLLRVLNLKYVIEPGEPVDGEPESPGPVRLQTISSVQSRAFVVFEAVVATSDDDAANELSRCPSCVFQRVILSNADHHAADGVAPGVGARGMAEPVIYEAERSTWRTDSSQPGFLVVTDAYYPGWTVTIDGQPAVLYGPTWRFGPSGSRQDDT